MNQMWQVFLISCFFSFGVQFLMYLYYRLTKNPLVSDYKSVVEYYSGIVGDGILVPLVNVFVVETLIGLGSWTIPSFPVLIAVMFMGIGITFIFHYEQQRFKLINWTMPKVGRWNGLGLYHALFMFAESSLLSLVLISSLGKWQQIPSFKWAILGLLIFLISFIYDYWNPVFKKLAKQLIK